MAAMLAILLCLLLFPVKSQADGENPSPFEFIKDLEGCQRGHKVEGIDKLKKYLQQFGYLGYSHDSNIDEFDDLLESAIKTYQINYHLKASGDLDSETVSAMVKPRCGVADIVNGASRMRSGSRSYPHGHGQGSRSYPHGHGHGQGSRSYPHGHGHGHGHVSIHTVAHYAFLPRTPRWPKTHFTYAFLSGTLNTTIVGAVKRAFGQWASATNFTFAQIANYKNADMVIGFHRGDHGDGFPFDGPGGSIAHSFAPTDGRLHFDADERWTVGASAGAFDVETVALHEIGHLLGLAHSSVSDAIMYPSISAGTTKRLQEDDIQGIQALYNRTLSVPSTPPPTTPHSCSIEIM